MTADPRVIDTMKGYHLAKGPILPSGALTSVNLTVTDSDPSKVHIESTARALGRRGGDDVFIKRALNYIIKVYGRVHRSSSSLGTLATEGCGIEIIRADSPVLSTPDGEVTMLPEMSSVSGIPVPSSHEFIFMRGQKSLNPGVCNIVSMEERDAHAGVTYESGDRPKALYNRSKFEPAWRSAQESMTEDYFILSIEQERLYYVPKDRSVHTGAPWTLTQSYDALDLINEAGILVDMRTNPEEFNRKLSIADTSKMPAPNSCHECQCRYVTMPPCGPCEACCHGDGDALGCESACDGCDIHGDY